MDGIIIKSIAGAIERIAPKLLAEDYDNVGLLIGNEKNQVKRVMVALEVTDRVIDQAIEQDVQLIVAHHPLIFRPQRRIDTQDVVTGSKITRLIQNDIGLYAAHTNLDAAQGGLNDFFCQHLGPIIDDQRKMMQVDMLRLLPIKNQPLERLLSYLKETFELDHIIYTGKKEQRISSVAVCTGSGMSFYKDAIEAGAEAYITGDLKYHEAMEARDRGIPVIDAGHFGTEIIVMDLFESILTDAFGENLYVIKAKGETNPMQCY